MYQNIIQKSTKYAIYAILAMFFLIGLGVGLLINDNKPSQIIIDKNVKIGLPAGGHVSDKIVNPTGSNFVASINGSAYYPVNCKAAEKIKEENKIWFGSAEEAETQGYKPAQNCR